MQMYGKFDGFLSNSADHWQMDTKYDGPLDNVSKQLLFVEKSFWGI